MIADCHGKEGVKYALDVAKKIFTKDELRDNVLLPSNATERGTLSPVRVKLLKTAVSKKFRYSPLKLEKVWRLVKTSINGMGRTIKRATMAGKLPDDNQSYHEDSDSSD